MLSKIINLLNDKTTLLIIFLILTIILLVFYCTILNKKLNKLKDCVERSRESRSPERLEENERPKRYLQRESQSIKQSQQTQQNQQNQQTQQAHIIQQPQTIPQHPQPSQTLQPSQLDQQLDLEEQLDKELLELIHTTPSVDLLGASKFSFHHSPPPPPDSFTFILSSPQVSVYSSDNELRIVEIENENEKDVLESNLTKISELNELTDINE